MKMMVNIFDLDDKQMNPQTNDKHENFRFKFPLYSFQNCEKLGNFFHSRFLPLYTEAAQAPSPVTYGLCPPLKNISPQKGKLSLKTLEQP